MRPHTFLVVVLALLVGPAAHAQSSESATIAEINRATDRFFAAFGQANATRIDSLLAPKFIWQPLGFIQIPRAALIERVRQRASDPKSLRWIKTTWSYRDVLVQGNTAVFNGEVDVTAETKGKPLRSDEIYNLVWVRDGGRWQLLHMLRSVGGAQLEALTWNKVFHDSVGFDLQPNRFLEQTIKNVTPGTALDVAMGQGRNTLLLARQGWRATGIDVASEGIRIAQEQAKREKLAIQTNVVDVRRYEFGTARWDLVAMIYFGELDQYLDRIYASLRPGGLLVFEGFHQQAVSRGNLSAQAPLPVEGLRQKLERAGFTVSTFSVVTDQADYGLRPSPLVRVAARKPK